jgi:hypothetical protein
MVLQMMHVRSYKEQRSHTVTKNINIYCLDHMELSNWLSAKYVLEEAGVADVSFIRWHLPAALYVHGILSTELTAKTSARMCDLRNYLHTFWLS